jgi:hypothetical protein
VTVCRAKSGLRMREGGGLERGEEGPVATVCWQRLCM